MVVHVWEGSKGLNFHLILKTRVSIHSDSVSHSHSENSPL
jgi:hypothetical protein